MGRHKRERETTGGVWSEEGQTMCVTKRVTKWFHAACLFIIPWQVAGKSASFWKNREREREREKRDNMWYFLFPSYLINICLLFMKHHTHTHTHRWMIIVMLSLCTLLLLFVGHFSILSSSFFCSYLISLFYDNRCQMGSYNNNTF